MLSIFFSQRLKTFFSYMVKPFLKQFPEAIFRAGLAASSQRHRLLWVVRKAENFCFVQARWWIRLWSDSAVLFPVTTSTLLPRLHTWGSAAGDSRHTNTLAEACGVTEDQRQKSPLQPDSQGCKYLDLEFEWHSVSHWNYATKHKEILVA